MIRTTRNRAYEFGEMELLINKAFMKRDRLRWLKKAASTRHGLMLLIVLCIMVFSCTGCIVRPAGPNEFVAVPAHTKVKMRYGLFASAEYENYRDTEAKVKCEYNPETKQFKLDAEFKETASTATVAQEGLMAEWTKQQQQQIDGLKWVVEQWKQHGENINNILARVSDMVSTLTNVLNVKLNKDGVQAGNALAPPGATAPAETDPEVKAFMEEQRQLNQAILDELKSLNESKSGAVDPSTPQS